ncbi:berberine bridge enzyme-like Cyn d 4 [Aegilops tauschii subsp. strangulata]|nr:berberine bridge enzyme-like Cyn d 4 [Aegilops tauschii subsp. strangulata]
MAKRFNLAAPLLLTLTFLFSSCSMISSSSQASPAGFLQCLTKANISVFEQGEDLFNTQLDKYIRNPKFLANTTGRPLYVVMPANAHHVQIAVRCGSLNGVPLRVRSGGHDYEGLSYRSVGIEGFAMLDMSELRTVVVDNQTSTAWVESGATLGELYYAISKASDLLGFPAGVCLTVGVGGHFSGGGFGTLMRKHGLAVGNVIDAELVDANGTLLNKTTMGDDVFWAIRGGGGGSFGVVLKWQVRLVPVPATVSVFKVSVSNSQGAAVQAVTKWQKVAPALPEELYIRALVQNDMAVFRAVFLGTCDALLPLVMSRSDGIPELNLRRSDCKEMTWIESVAYVNNATVEDLTKRTTSEFDSSNGFKATTDYVRRPIRREVWAKIFNKQLGQPNAQIVLVPYGGRMSNVKEDATPFPHRAGVMYSMQLYNYWPVDSGDESGNAGAVQSKWVRDMYAFMSPYVSSNSKSRGAYFNCRDLDLGPDWGPKYFNSLFGKHLGRGMGVCTRMFMKGLVMGSRFLLPFPCLVYDGN